MPLGSMRPYIHHVSPLSLPLSFACQQRRGDRDEVSFTIAQNENERYRPPPFAALLALCETGYPLTLPAVSPSTRNRCA